MTVLLQVQAAEVQETEPEIWTSIKGTLMNSDFASGAPLPRTRLQSIRAFLTKRVITFACRKATYSGSCKRRQSWP